MAAGRLDITIEIGATYELSLTWKDANDNPIAMSGYTAKMQIKDRPGGTTLITLTDASGISLGDSDGSIYITIDSAVTSTFALSKAVYDLKITDTSNKTRRLIQGQVIFSPPVTI